MDADFSTGCSWLAPTVELLHLPKSGLRAPSRSNGTIPSMIRRFIVFALAHPLFHSYMRHRCSATRFSHPYGFKPQRAAHRPSHILSNQNTFQHQRAFGLATHDTWRALICELLLYAPLQILSWKICADKISR